MLPTATSKAQKNTWLSAGTVLKIIRKWLDIVIA